MFATLRAELRKLWTVRSTYTILAISWALMTFFSLFVAGWRAKPAELANAGWLATQVTSSVQPLSLILAIAAVLLVTHEYRYNTIVYSLTASRSRIRVFVAKILAVSVFAIAATLVFGALAPLMTAWGVGLHHHHLVTQHIAISSLLWRSVLTGWGISMLAFILSVLIRIQVGAIAALLLIPSTLESLLGLLLKKNQVYLPFNSLNALVDVSANPGYISYTRAALVASSYILVGLIAAGIVFVRRDAS